MKNIKLTIIKCEKRERIVLRYRNGARREFCAGCKTEQSMLSAGSAAQLLHLSERRIFALVDAGEFHIFETEHGQLFICFDSLQRAFGRLNLEETAI